MIAGIVGNLIANLIWVPIAWVGVRELRRYRAVVERSHAKTHALMQSVQKQVAALTDPDEQAQP